ncbi:MAG: hypothetical protein M9925_04585 [Chloroflexi bacterium]|nr:hypothetical protein [Dehalococcoidia bacterium]MCO5200959.1 hypothetical protein [Chloroflexota bacterium]PWB48249.1 MAG: hypothetical protein C3F10_00570 [Dehalococcoidia bacterium]
MRTRLYVAAVIAGLALLVITVIVVANYGRHDPSPPSLRDDPNLAIPGSIIFLDEKQCILRAVASGAGIEEVYCLSRNDYPSEIYFVDDTTILFTRYDSRGPVLFELNTQTRAIRDLGAQPTSPKPVETGLVSPSGEEVFAEYDGRIVILKDGTRTTITEFDTRDYGGPSPVTWSPDGQWILLRYWARTHPELWIISRDGATQGTLTTDASGSAASWYIEGVGTYPPIPESYQR